MIPKDRIEENDQGIDDLVITNADMVHLERLSEGHYWLGIYRGEQRIVIEFDADFGPTVINDHGFPRSVTRASIEAYVSENELGVLQEKMEEPERDDLEP